MTSETRPSSGAMAFFAMPLCYIAMFVIYAVPLDFPQGEDLPEKVAYVADHQSLIALANIIGYLVFGGLLLIAVQAMHRRFSVTGSDMLNSAGAFGLIWVVLMMCSGMTALVGMDTMVTLHGKGSAHAESLFVSYTTLVNALGGGIELVGGLWVLLLSICGLRHGLLAKGLHVLGLMVGVLGICTVYQGIPEFKDAFGLSQVIWFIWMGIALLRSSNEV